MIPFGNSRSQPLTLPLTELQVRMIYPDGTNTVDSAVGYMLEPHAYRPAYRDASGEFIAQRSFINNFGTDPVPMSMAMERLVGHDAQVMLDRDRKLYAFRLKNPGEPGVVFADLGIETSTSAARPAFRERLAQPAPAANQNIAPGNDAALTVVDPPPGTDFKHAPACCKRGSVPNPVEDRNICRSIKFRNREMLSETVRKYFLDCGFEEVFWKLGEPGRYADYRLSQDIDVPLPERHLDLIELLQTRFGIKTLINEDHSVEFHDENSTL